MSFESPKTEKKIPSSFSSPEFAGPNAHEMSVMSNDSTMDSIATNVSSSMTESKIIKSVNSNTHDSGFGDSALEDSSTTSKKLIARTEHLITVSNEPGQPDITLMTRIDNREKSKLKSVEEDIDVKQASEEVITIVKTTKLTTKVEKVRRKKRKNSKKLQNGQESLSKTPSQESNGESVDDSTQNQSESLVYQVDINKSTEELVYQTMNKKNDEIETSETKPSAEPVLDLNSTVLDCEEILSNYSASNANNPGSPRHNLTEKEPEQLVPRVSSVPSEPPIATNGALGSPLEQQLKESKKKSFFKRFRSRDKKANAKRKLDPKSDTPASPSKQFKPAKHYNLEKYVLLSADEKDRILYMKKECVDLIVEKLSDLIEHKNDQVLNEMVSRSLDLLRHDRIESFDKLAQELEREYNIANVAVFDANQMQSVFNKQMKKLIIDEKALLGFELDKTRKPCEEFIEFDLGKEEIGANLNLISSQNLISQIEETEPLEQANQNEMDEKVKEKCPTPPSTPQNELGCGDGAPKIKDSSIVSPAELSKEILTKVNESTQNDTSVQTPRQTNVNRKPKRKSTLSSCFTCAGVLKLSDDESRPQQQKEKKNVVVVSKPNEQEVTVRTSAADVIVQTTLITHDLDKKPVDNEAVEEQEKNVHEEKFITLDTDDAVSQINSDEKNNQEMVDREKEEANNVQSENVDETKLNEEEKPTDESEQTESNKVNEEAIIEESTTEVTAKKSKNKKKKKKKKNKIDKSECVSNDQQLETKNQETKETSTQEDDETEIKIENNESNDSVVLSVAVDDDGNDQDEKVNEQKEEQIEIKSDQGELASNIVEEKECEIKKDVDDDDQLELNRQVDTNIHVIETLRVITERVVKESQPVEIQIDESKCDQKEHQIEIKQEIEIGKELPVEIDTDLYKPAAVQQNDPVVLPDPREKVISLAVESESQAQANTEPAAAAAAAAAADGVKEAESEEDGSKISCFSCRGKKAAKKAKGPKQPIVKSQPAQPEPIGAENSPAKQTLEIPRSVDASLFVGLDSTEKKLDTQSELSLDKKQCVKLKDAEIESPDVANITPSLIGSTSIEQPQSIETEIKQENHVNIEKEKDIVVEVIYESKQEEKIESTEVNDNVSVEKIEKKSIENVSLSEPSTKFESIEHTEVIVKEEQVNLGQDKSKLSDDPVVLPDPSDRPIVEIVQATPLIESSQPVEQTPKISKKSSFSCCGGKKSKKNKTKKTSKIDLPIVNILAPKAKKIDNLKVVEEKAKIEEKKVLDKPSETEAIADSHELPHVDKIPPKDWAKGLDRSQSTELIRREPEVSEIKITDNLNEQLTNVTIDIPSHVDINEIKVTKSESVKISELEVKSKSDEAENLIEQKIVTNEDDVLSSENAKTSDDIDEKEQIVDSTESNAKTEIEDLTFQTSLTIDSPGAIIQIDREPDHAIIPDCTKERVAQTQVEQTGAQEEQLVENSETKITKKKTKNKKKKRTSRIDLPLVNILVPKHEKIESRPTDQTKSVSDVIHLEQNVAKVINLGNDLDKPVQLVEKDTKVDITLPSEVEVKKINVDLKIDTVDKIEHVPEINISISEYHDQQQVNEENNQEVENDTAEQQQNVEDTAVEQSDEVNNQIAEHDVSEEQKIVAEITQEQEEQKEIEIVNVTEQDKEAIIDEKVETVADVENKVDVSFPIADISVPDVKKLDHEPDVVVLPEVDLSARAIVIQETETPLTQVDVKPVESKKSKKKSKRTSKIDLPLIDIFTVKEKKNTSTKTETNVYIDMPVVDLDAQTKTNKKIDHKEPTSCFACKSNKSKKSKKNLQPEPVRQQIPKIVEPTKSELDSNEVNKSIEILDQNIDQAETSNLTKIVKEADQTDVINVVPLIVDESIAENKQIQSLENVELNKEESFKTQEEFIEIKYERKEEEQKNDETEIKIENNESNDSVVLSVAVDDDGNDQDEKANEQKEEQIEIKSDQSELASNIVEEKECEIKKDVDDDDQLELNRQVDTNIHVIETLRVITERVVKESQPIEIQIDESKCDKKEHQIEIKQEIEIGKELPVEIDTDLYKPAAVQQNDPVVLPDPREKVISLAVESESQAQANTEPAAAADGVKEAESEEDASKISCFSCRGKKAAKKAKGPKQPIVKSQPAQPEPIGADSNLTPQIKSVNLELFRGLDKPSSLSEMEKAIDYSDLSVVPTITIRESQAEEVVQQVPQSIVIELPTDLTSAIDLPPTSPSKEQMVQVKSEMEQILEPVPVPETQIPTIKIEETFDYDNSTPIDLTTPPKKPPRGHLDTSVIDETEILTDQNVKMNVKEALIKVNSPEEFSKLDETKTKKEKKSKTSIIDLPLIDILVPKECKSKSKSDNIYNNGKELHIEPKGTSIELNQPELELFIEKCDSSKNKIQTIDLSNDDKKLLKAKRNEICEYLKQHSGYKLEQLIERTSQTTSKKELKAKEKLADKLYQRSIKLMTKSRVKPMSFAELSKKLEKIASPKTNAADIQKCVDQIKHELQNESLFSCLREKKSEQIVEKPKEQNAEFLIENEAKNEKPQVDSAEEKRKDSISSEILLRCPNLSWREANERARILFYKGQIPSIHYNEKRDSFHVSRLINASGKEKMCQVPVTDDDVKKLLNSCGLYWNGESIGILDKSDEIFNSAQQEAFDILNSIQVSESIQITENHCETVEQSKINYIY